jgi:hypothetical protein
VAHSHTLVSERGEALTGAGGELLDDLDAVDLGAELGEHGGLIPRAGADLEHSISRAYGSELGHEGDHVGLADRDVVADRQGMIGVGSILGAVRDEEVACGAGLAERARSGDRRPRAGGRERARGLVTWSEA